MQQRVHFIGICGAGMSAVAKLLKEQGCRVTGSDESFYPPISDYLKANNLPCVTPYAASNIPDDVTSIVIGKNTKLVPETNSEVAEAFRLKETAGVGVVSFPEILKDLTAKTSNYVVAGSFGKSTCATLLAQTLIQAGKNPSYFLGGVPLDIDSNAHIGTGNIFILEGDEYPSSNWDNRSKFLYYNSSSLLLISAEHDHLNVFLTIEDYLKPYRELINILPASGTLVACLEGEHVSRLIEETRGQRQVASVELYSLYPREGSNWWAENIKCGETTVFDLIHNGQKVSTLETQLLGDHMIQNMVGVAALLLTEQKVTVDQLVLAGRQFCGVKGRLELKTNGQILVYEDYGSSRPKALAGFKTLRQYYPGRIIIAIFKPHTFSWRNRNSLEWYDTLFDDVDMAFIFEPASQGAGTHDQVSRDEIIARIIAANKTAYGVSTKKELLQKLTPILKGNEVIIMSTSGSMNGAIEAVTEYVEKKFTK